MIRARFPSGGWTPQDVYRFNDYVVTSSGHIEAETVRRRRRDSFTDAALGAELPALIRPWMTEAESRAVGGPLAALRVALDAEQGAAAVGASKDLVEASCKVVIARAGVDAGRHPALPTLFKIAHRCLAGKEFPAEELGRSLASTAQRLAELRNTAGSGHGHASPPQLGIREARLAAAAATGLSAYILGAWV